MKYIHKCRTVVLLLMCVLSMILTLHGMNERARVRRGVERRRGSVYMN